LEHGVALPSPNALKRKILLKGSKTKKYTPPLHTRIINIFQQGNKNSIEKVDLMQSQDENYSQRQSQITIASEISHVSDRYIECPFRLHRKILF
jgi:hypothetical protein